MYIRSTEKPGWREIFPPARFVFGGGFVAKRKTIAEFAREYLVENGFDAVAWGDSRLLHEIAEYAGLPHRAWRTEKQVLDALDRSPLFEKRYFRGLRNRPCRWFVVRERN